MHLEKNKKEVVRYQINNQIYEQLQHKLQKNFGYFRAIRTKKEFFESDSKPKLSDIELIAWILQQNI